MDQIQYGIVGFGGIAENRIAKEGFALDRDRYNHQILPFTLAGATDINKGRKSAANALGIRWYESVDELLKNPKIDAIYVATSNSTHFEVAMKALQAKKHVIIEKPMTVDINQAKKLVETAEKFDLSICTNLMMTKNVYNRKAKELIRSGVAGHDLFTTLHMEFLYGKDPAEAQSWRCSRPEELGGPIGDVGAHCLDMGEFLFDEQIRSLRCTYYPPTLDIAVENGAVISYILKNGLEGCVRVAFNQPRGGVVGTLQNLGYEIYGERGVIRGYGTMFQLSGHQDEPAPVRLELVTDEISKTYCMADVENIYQAQITEHANSIINNQRMDGRRGLRNILLVLACHESASNGGKEVMI